MLRLHLLDSFGDLLPELKTFWDVLQGIPIGKDDLTVWRRTLESDLLNLLPMMPAKMFLETSGLPTLRAFLDRRRALVSANGHLTFQTLLGRVEIQWLETDNALKVHLICISFVGVLRQEAKAVHLYR